MRREEGRGPGIDAQPSVCSVAHTSTSWPVQCEVPGIEQVDFRIWKILLEGLSTRRNEGRVVLAPDHEGRRLMVAEPRLPLRVGRDVAPVVIEQVHLNLSLTGPRQTGILVDPAIRIVAVRMGCACDVALLGGFKRKKSVEYLRMSFRISPEFCDLRPFGSETCFIDIAVLNDQRMQLIGVCQNDAEADRRSVVVKVQGVTRDLQLLQKSPIVWAR